MSDTDTAAATTAEVIAGYRFDGEIDHSNPAQANQVRAGWAAEALKTYAERTGLLDDDLETVGSEMVASLLHLLWLNGAGLEAVMFRGIGHFEAEQKEQKEA